MKHTSTCASILVIAIFGVTNPVQGAFFVVKKLFGGGQDTTTVAAGVPFTVEVNATVESVWIYSNALDPTTEDLGRVTIRRTNPLPYQQIWVYIVAVPVSPTPGDEHYPLAYAACSNWAGLENVNFDGGEGGLLVRAVIDGNLTGTVEARDGNAGDGGVMNLLVGGSFVNGSGVESGSDGTCRVRAGGSIEASIQSAAGIAEVLAETGYIRGHIVASSGTIGVMAAPNGDIGPLFPVLVSHQIAATNGIGELTASGSISANVSASGSITRFDAGQDYRGTMTLSGFTDFHIGRDLWGPGIVNLTSALPANRVMAIDRWTGVASQINILPAAGLLGQIDINRDNAGGEWAGIVTVNGVTLSGSPSYTNTASSLGGGSVGKVPFGLHDESCSPPNGEPEIVASGTTLASVRLRHYGRLSWNPSTIPVLIYRQLACSGAGFTQVTGASFALDSADSRTLIVTYPFQSGYEYKITPNGVLQCDTPGNPSVDWGAGGEYTFRVKSLCAGDVTGVNAIPDGEVNIDDLLVVIGGWGTCPVPASCCIADMDNDDGLVDIDDLLAVISGWGPCSAPAGPPQGVWDCYVRCGGLELSEFGFCLEKCVQNLESP